MVTPDVDQLKSEAFKLSKILTTYKVKLSSQQALDALSRLYWNVPYEALRTQTGPSTHRPVGATPPTTSTLANWLAVGQSFCDGIRTLDREGVNQAAWNGHHVPSDGLHWDARRFMRAAGVAADRFSGIARDFVERQQHMRDLTFIVEAGTPIMCAELAIMRIQIHEPDASTPQGFVGLELLQETCKSFLFGAEARVELVVRDTDTTPDRPPFHSLAPTVRLTYRVSGQPALKAFGSVLKHKLLQGVWHGFGPLNVHTDILLTRHHSQDSIEEDWTTDQDPDGKRLLAFCSKASKLTDEETCDWPPYFELFVDLTSTNSEQDLKRYWVNICAHAMCLYGGGEGWHEFMKARDTSQS